MTTMSNRFSLAIGAACLATLTLMTTVVAQVPKPQVPNVPAKPVVPALPDNRALDAVMRDQQQRATTDLEAASRQLGPPGAPRGGITLPSINPSGGAVDIEQLARMYSDMKAQPDSEDTPNLIVFVSLSMPEASLIRIGQQAAKARAVVAVRGLRYGFGKGAMDKSVKALEPLIKTGADVQVHPELFQRYNIQSVPTVVVASDADRGCAQDACASKSAAIRGDASLDYILDRIAARPDVVGSIAKERLKLLRPN